jgi:hypothetical protein
MVQAETDWGSLTIVPDAQGYLSVVLENEALRVCYGHGLRFHRERDMHESYIVEFMDKRTGEDQVQYNKNGFGWGCLDAGEWHGLIKSANQVVCNELVLTVRIEWEPIQGPVAIKEISLFKGQPWLKIDYLSWCVNIFDIGVPGGTIQGKYYLHGMDAWKRPLTYYPEIYFDRSPVDLGYENITELDEAGPLNYQGWFVMGIYNPENGRGFGRLAPVDSTDIIKLLFADPKIGQRGFELFPCYERTHAPYGNYLFPLTDGAQGVLSTAEDIIHSLESMNP